MPTKSEKKFFWRQLEDSCEESPPGADALLAALQFNNDGLLPVIAQCADNRQVLMLAWMNRQALEQTLAGGQMIYYSRSRQTLWRKGESSGNVQHLVSLSADCDGDTLLAVVKQTGAACHTGRRSCFYVRVAAAGADEDAACL